MALSIEGAYTALITPFRDGSIDHEALRELVERQIEGGIDGLVPCGTTGESATMTADERLDVIAAVADVANGRVPVIAGTGSNDTRASIEFTRRVAEIDGVDGALVVTPYYNKPGPDGLFRHFTAIADGGGLPVVLYNVPSRTAVSMTPETVARLATHPNIVAIKDATADMLVATRIRELAGDDLTLLSGDDFTTFPLLCLGGRGTISVVSNLVPDRVAALCRATLAGDLASARTIHFELQPLIHALFTDTNPIPVKTAASLLGWCGPELRAPLYPPQDEVRERLRQVLTDVELL